jgi:putative FmdB family regulatory protein
MRVHEFLCEGCGHRWSVLCADKDDIRTCPKCWSSFTRRVISQVSVVYSGSGWTGAGRKSRG